ncbi:MAG: alpha/beta hydrolase [Anaerolineales bacterium]|nr:alpha/beta fold hydrolase [Anaerolineae bacterium]PWB70716.1 MAG: alpha/beta hydrolase [Anaerolineales bacterium]
MEKISVNNIELAYIRKGSGSPLMLLHGYPLDHHLWDEITPLLEDIFDLIIPDLRGFGESTTVDQPYTMDDIAADLAGLLDHLGIQKTAVAGHSMGGYVALAFARLYPERVSGLGLVSTQVLADPPDRKEGRYKSAADVAENGTASVVEAMTPKFTSDERLQAFARKTMERQQPAAYIGALKAMAERTDATSLLASIKYPVVIVHGDADSLIPVDRAREVKAAIPGAHLAVLSGAGHMPMMEARDETAKALGQLV